MIRCDPTHDSMKTNMSCKHSICKKLVIYQYFLKLSGFRYFCAICPSYVRQFCRTQYTKQETPLSLPNRATRLEVSQGRTWYHMLGILLVCYSNFFRYSTSKNVMTLKTGLGVREGH